MTEAVRSRNRTLCNALRVILPTEAETELLRAILYSGDEGQNAWHDWRRRIGDPIEAFRDTHREQKGLIPLLHVATVRNEVELDSRVGGFLRAAYFREQLRGNAYRRILRETLTAIAADGPAPVVMRGCALSDTVYDVPEARHSHGINLLLQDADADRAVAALLSQGFQPVRGRDGSRASRFPLSWTHAQGLPLELHTQLLDIPRYAAPMSEVWSRVRPLPQWEPVARMLAFEDALIQVAGNAAHSAGRNSLRWACDASLLMARQPGLDWSLVLAIVEATRLALPLSITMRYLAEELGASVPAEMIAQLDALADRSDYLAYEIAVLGALGGAHAKMRRKIATAPDWRARFTLLRCLLIPSAASMRATGHASDSWRLPYHYLRRPIVYAARSAFRLGMRPA